MNMIAPAHTASELIDEVRSIRAESRIAAERTQQRLASVESMVTGATRHEPAADGGLTEMEIARVKSVQARIDIALLKAAALQGDDPLTELQRELLLAGANHASLRLAQSEPPSGSS